MGKSNGVQAPKMNIIKGKPENIPADLGRARNAWDWGQLEVGDHVEVPFDEAASARSSATSYGRGTKERSPRTFATKTVERDGKKVVQIWRLPDPVPVTESTGGTNASA